MAEKVKIPEKKRKSKRKGERKKIGWEKARDKLGRQAGRQAEWQVSHVKRYQNDYYINCSLTINGESKQANWKGTSLSRTPWQSCSLCSFTRVSGNTAAALAADSLARDTSFALRHCVCELAEQKPALVKSDSASEFSWGERRVSPGVSSAACMPSLITLCRWF